MILLLLFSILSTIRVSVSQKPNYEYCVVRMRENSGPLKIIKKNIADFLFGSKYEK